MLLSIVSNLPAILVEDDKINAAVSAILTAMIAPMVHSKHYPDNLSAGFLDLMAKISSLEVASRSWKRDISEALNDPRILQTKPDLMKRYWLQILKQYCLVDKSAISDLLGRIPAPTTSGIVFGVGAASARLEADKRTQLCIRRIILCLLASPKDSFSGDVPTITEKVAELVTANATTAPSSSTRGEIFMLLRALVLKISPKYLASLWPFANEELYQAILSVSTAPAGGTELYDNQALIQSCKLLDVLLLVAPDDFQLHQWIFITDTIDVAYRSEDWSPVSIVDTVSDSLSKLGVDPSGSSLTENRCARLPIITKDGVKFRRSFFDAIQSQASGIDDSSGVSSLGRSSSVRGGNTGGGLRKDGNNTVTGSNTTGTSTGSKAGKSQPLRPMSRPELITTVVRPFLRYLSQLSYEMMFEAVEPDIDSCVDSLLEDIFHGVLAG